MAVITVQLARFRSRSDVVAYRRNLKAQTKENFYVQHDKTYKENYIKALRNKFGSRANALIEKIKAMAPKDVVAQGNAAQEATFAFNYNPLDDAPKLTGILAAWNVDEATADSIEDFYIGLE